jgi:hypothetical protein
LVGPTDSDGHVCGYQGPEYATHKYFYTVTTSGLGVCVTSCPSANVNLTSIDPDDYYCLSQVPTDPTEKQAYIAAFCMSGGSFVIGGKSANQTAAIPGISAELISIDSCLCNIKRPTKDVLRRCQFLDSNIRSNYINQHVPTYFEMFVADVYVARNVIFGFGFGLAIFLSFIYSHLLSYEWLGDIIVWSSFIAITVVLGVGVYFSEERALIWGREDPQIHSDNEILSLKIFGWVMVALAILFVCTMIFLRKQINLSIKVIALSSGAINDMIALVFVPVLMLIAFAAFMVPCIIYMFYVASDGTITTTFINGIPVGKSYRPAPGVIDRLWYLFFCLLWTMNWIGGISAITIATAVAKWYFTETKSLLTVNSFTVIRALGISMRFHQGTAAFGALLIAIVQFVRWFLLYLQKQANDASGGHLKCILKYTFCIVDCCLWCLEKCVKFISKNAYIQTAIHVRFNLAYICQLNLNHRMSV